LVGQNHAETRADGGPVEDLDLASVLIHDLFDQREAEPDAVASTRVEHVEQPFALFTRDATTFVGNL
jgi:hypothetical protein